MSRRTGRQSITRLTLHTPTDLPYPSLNLCAVRIVPGDQNRFLDAPPYWLTKDEPPKR